MCHSHTQRLPDNRSGKAIDSLIFPAWSRRNQQKVSPSCGCKLGYVTQMADEPKGVRINTKIPNLCSLRFGFIASTIRLLYIIYLDAGGWIRNGYGWPFKRLSILRSTRRMSNVLKAFAAHMAYEQCA